MAARRHLPYFDKHGPMYRRPITVLAWPARNALQNLQRSDDIFVIAIDTAPTNDRPAARRQIRAAVIEALGVLNGCAPSRFDLATVPGQPPRLVGTQIGISLAHEVGLSVAAIHLRGAVGIDIVKRDAVVQPEVDWYLLAHDYLGPAALKRIDDADRGQRPQVFATEWAAQEARLKCRGLGLIEWDAARESMKKFDLHPLELAPPWIGMLAIEKPLA